MFASFHAGGNLAPVLGIGAELRERGHQVTVLGDRTQARDVERAGLRFVGNDHRPPWVATEDRSDLRAGWSTVNVATSSRRGGEAARVAREIGADVVVIDCVLLSAIKAIRDAGLPHVILFHFFHRYADHPLARLPLALGTGALGLSHRALWRGADLGIVCTDRDLDPTPAGAHADNVVWTGVVQGRLSAGAETVAATDPPRVLISLSTINYRGMAAAWQSIFDGVRDAPFEVIATVGPAVDIDGLNVPGNVDVRAYVPHDEILRSCSAVLSHGGHATTTRALSYGLPVAVMPMHPLLDQPMVGAAVARAGAGVVLRRTSGPARIRSALERILGDPAYAEAARVVGERIRSTNGAATAAARIEGMVRA